GKRRNGCSRRVGIPNAHRKRWENGDYADYLDRAVGMSHVENDNMSSRYLRRGACDKVGANVSALGGKVSPWLWRCSGRIARIVIAWNFPFLHHERTGQGSLRSTSWFFGAGRSRFVSTYCTAAFTPYL